MRREHTLIRCIDCGKQISEDHVTHCDTCGASLCEERVTIQLCSACAELWESEIDLEDTEAEE